MKHGDAFQRRVVIELDEWRAARVAFATESEQHRAIGCVHPQRFGGPRNGWRRGEDPFQRDVAFDDQSAIDAIGSRRHKHDATAARRSQVNGRLKRGRVVGGLIRLCTTRPDTKPVLVADARFGFRICRKRTAEHGQTGSGNGSTARDGRGDFHGWRIRDVIG